VLLQIRSFLTVVEEGSLHRAAARLNISQSALSRQVQALEHELGGPLLERSSTGVVPTIGGRALVKRMASFLANYDANLQAVRRIIRGDAGELRIGYLASAFHEHLEPSLRKLRRLYPHTKVKLLDLFPGEQITALRKGEIDLAFLEGSAALSRRDFQMKKVAVLRCFVSLPDDHPLASKKKVKIAELRTETFIVGSENEVPGIRSRLVRFCRLHGNFTPKMIEIPGGIAEGFSAVANDGAVALLPAIFRRHKRPGMILVPIADPGATWEMVVAWQKSHNAESLLALVDALPSAE
jgi:DNA-binding transcriptional LysR family regulator